MRRVRRDPPLTLPFLGPQAEALRALAQMPIARLRAAAQAREIAAPSRATRVQLANLLVLHAMRAQSEADYRETGIAFDSRSVAYPHVRRMVARHELRHIFDIGCGPGLFAEELLRSRTLPRDGSYVGIDVSPAAIELAQTRLAGDPRFTFRVGDAEHLDGPVEPHIDGIVVSFVLSYLDTHAVHRLAATLAHAYPRATLIVALTFRSSVDRIDDAAPDEDRELRAARRYLRGDTAVADGRWDTRRLVHYRTSIETYYRITEERTLPAQAQMLWVGRARLPRAIRAKPRTMRTIVRTPRRRRTT